MRLEKVVDARTWSKSAALLIAALALYANGDMESLLVPAGETLTVTASATYDTVTVNGTLIVSAGTLTATNAFRVADGAGATGTLVITNSAKISSSEGTLAVGVNGGNGLVRLYTTGNICRFVELGDGGGASTICYIGGGVQSRHLRKKGAGTCRLEFMGGGPSFTIQNFLYLDEGTLVLASINGAAIALSCAGANGGVHTLFDTSSGSGTLTTEGTGAVNFSFRQWISVSQTFAFGTSPRVTWGHSGGFSFSGVDTKSLRVDSPDCFNVGGTPAKLSIYGGWLDVNGKHVAVEDLSGYGGVTNETTTPGAVVLGGDNADHSLNGNWNWSLKSPLCKVGSGTLTYGGTSFSGMVLVSNGVFRAAALHDDAVYSHYRFVIDDCMGTSRNSMQLSRFRLLCDGADITVQRSGYIFGEGADDRAPSQSPDKALDGNFATKWLTMKTGAYNAEDLYKTNCWLQIDFATPRGVSAYDWAAANDYGFATQGNACRDPMKWRLLGSDDGETWTELDSRDIGCTNLARSAWTGPYSIATTNELTFGAISLAGGAFEVMGNVGASSIEQTGGDFRIAETGTLRLVDGEWKYPSFTGDSKGSVVSDAADENNVLCETASFSGDLAVASGVLSFKLPSATTHRLFRFTIKKTYSDTVCTQLSRLMLYDANGNVLNNGLTAANPGTDPASLDAGKCAYAANYAQGGSSSVKNLFDGNTGTKMCLTQLTMGGDPENNTWRTVIFRLAAGVTAPAVSYQLTTANDNTPARNPSVWTLESSADGENWTLLDSRSPGDFINPTRTYTDFNDGEPMSFTAGSNMPVENVALADGAFLSVAYGASLGMAGTTFSAAGLRVDCTALGGTISCLAPRNGGCLDLVNFPQGTDIADYRVPVTVLSFADRRNFSTWSVRVNGELQGGLRVVCDGNGLKIVRKGMCVIIH